jgi:hypothetical protein
MTNVWLVGLATLASAAPVLGQTISTLKQEASGTMVVCGPNTAGHTALGTTVETTPGTTDSTGITRSGTSATAGATTTLGRSLDNDVNSETARLALRSSQANLEKLSSLKELKIVCVVDLDTLAQKDSKLKEDIFRYGASSAKIKSVLKASAKVVGAIGAQHPSFNIDTLFAADIGPNGELILFISRSAELEFLFTYTRAVSLFERGSELVIGSPFEHSAIAAALHSYEVRFISINEQDKSDFPLGGEGTSDSAYVISKKGRDLLVVFGDLETHRVDRIEAMAGVIDVAGATLGSSLKKALPLGNAVCGGVEAGGCWSARIPEIFYTYSGPDECVYEALDIGEKEVASAALPACLIISGIELRPPQ